MGVVERDGAEPEAALPENALRWVDRILAQWSPLSRPNPPRQEAIRQQAVLVLSACLRSFGPSSIDELCRKYLSSFGAMPESVQEGLSWSSRGQIYVGSTHWGAERSWSTPAGEVCIRWAKAAKKAMRSTNPEDRAVFASLAFVEGGLLIELVTAQEGSQLRQAEANRETSAKVLASEEAAAFHEVLSALSPTKTQPNRTILEVELGRFTTRRVTQRLLRPRLAERLWGPIRLVNQRYVAEGDSVVEVGSRWQLVQRLEAVAGELIAALVQAEDGLLAQWHAAPVAERSSVLVSLDRLPEELRVEIEASVAQQRRWFEVYGEEAQGSGRVVDTSILPSGLASRVESSFSGELTGVLIAGDAVHGMRYLQSQPEITVRCTYADPPYNTGGDGFPYVDGMPHGSWLCFMEQNLLALAELCPEGRVMLSIGDREAPRLQLLLQEIFGESLGFGPVIVQVNKGGRDYLPIATTHEFLLGSGIGGPPKLRELPKSGLVFRFEDALGGWNERELRNRNPRFHKQNRPNLYYPFYVNPVPASDAGHCEVSLQARDGWVEVWPLNSKGESSVWRWGRPKVAEALAAGDPAGSEVVARMTRNQRFNIYEKVRKTTTKAKSVWDDSAVRTEQGSIELRRLFGEAVFPHPKPRALVERCLEIGSAPGDWVLDFFGGSGTTADAALSLARRGEGLRPVALIEHGSHFERVLKPRVLKAAYSGSWADARPQDETPVSVCYRVVELADWLDG